MISIVVEVVMDGDTVSLLTVTCLGSRFSLGEDCLAIVCLRFFWVKRLFPLSSFGYSVNW